LARRQRSFEQLAWFVDKVDACYIFDNSTGEPQLLAEKMGPGLVLWDELPADLLWTLEMAGVFIHKLYTE